MSRMNRLGVGLLALGMVFAAWHVPTVSAQKSGGGSQSNKKDKDKDKDDDQDRNKGDRKDRGNKSDNQGNNQNSGQSNNSGQGNPSNNPNNKQNNSNDVGKNPGNPPGQGFGSNPGSNSSNAGNPNKGGNNPQAEQIKQFQQLMQQRRGNNRDDDNADRDRDKNRDRDMDRDRDRDRGPNFGPGDSNRFIGPGQPNFINKLPNGTFRLPNPPAESPANKKLGYWQGDKWQGTQKADTWVQVFGGHDKPFSPQWYKEHPQAWKYDNNRWNVWVTASVPGVYSWLNWGPAPREYSVGFGPERFDPNRFGDWYPLGVFSMQSGPDDVGTRVVQLALDRRGNVTGNYYDMITNVNHNISGGVDRDSQRVMWWLDRNPSIQFHARIYRLLQPYGSIYVELPGGDQRWQFVRLEN